METESSRPYQEIVWLDNEGVLHVEVQGDADLQLEDAKRTIEMCGKLTQGHSSPALVHLGKIKSVSRDARLYYGSEEAARVLAAVALLVDSSASKIIANFMIGLNSKAMAMKFQVFDDEQDAYAWLREFLHD